MKTTCSTIRLLSLAATCGLSVAQPDSPHLANSPGIQDLPAGAVVKLGALPAEDPQWVNLSPDGKKLLMLARKGSRWAVYENGAAGEPYDEIPTAIHSEAPFPPAFTADGKTSLHLARRDGKYHLVIDGKPGEALDGIANAWIAPAGGGYAMLAMKAGKPVFQRDGVWLPIPGLADGLKLPRHRSMGRYSPDGRRFMYLLETPDQNVRRYVLENQLLPPFASYEQGSWVFGAGDSYAYSMQERVGREPSHRVVFNGKTGPAFASTSFPKISGDGKHIVYQVSRPLTKEELDIVLPPMDGEIGRKHKMMRERGIGHPMMVSRLVRDGVELPVTTEPVSGVSDFVVGPAGQVATAYTSSWSDVDEIGRPSGSPKGVKVWIDGKSSLQYDSWAGTHFSPDGSLTLSFVVKDGQYYVLANDEELGPYTNVDTKGLHFFPEGNRYQFVARLANGTTALIENGKPSPHRFDGGMIHSPDGKRTAYVSFRGKDSQYSDAIYCNLIVDEKVHEVPGTIREISFSPDGSRVACLFQAPPSNGKNSPVQAWVDDRAIPPLDKQEDAHSLEFSPDGKHFAYTATVDVPDHPKRNGASGYSMNVRVIDERPGPLLYLDYKAPAVSKEHGNIIVTRHYPTTFGQDGTVSYFGRDDESLFRISLSLENLAALPDLAKRAVTHAEAAKAESTQMEKQKEVAASGEPFQVPHVFEWPYPENTCALLEGNDGNLYGSAFVGRFKTGALFRCNGDGSGFKVLHEFTGGDGDGLAIRSMVKGSDGTIYMALGPNERSSERTKWKAAIFRLDPGAEKPVPMYLAPEGAAMEAKEVDVLEYPMFSQITPEDVIYGGLVGRTYLGFGLRFTPKPQPLLEIISDNSHNAWTVARKGTNLVAVSGNSLNDNKGRTGLLPVEAGGRIYSLTGGGRGGAGMMVSTARDGSDIRTEYEFTFESPEGGDPNPVLQPGPDGSIFGITTKGGARGDSKDHGAIFRFDPRSKNCVPVVFSDHYHRFGRPVTMGSDGALYFLAGSGLYGITSAEAAAGQPFEFPDPNKKKVPAASARFPKEIHTFMAFRNEKIDSGEISGFAISALVSLSDGGFAGIGGDAGGSRPPFLFTLRPKK